MKIYILSNTGGFGGKGKGLRIAINPDAHNMYCIRNIGFGVGIAERAGLKGQML